MCVFVLYSKHRHVRIPKYNHHQATCQQLILSPVRKDVMDMY